MVCCIYQAGCVTGIRHARSDWFVRRTVFVERSGPDRNHPHHRRFEPRISSKPGELLRFLFANISEKTSSSWHAEGLADSKSVLRVLHWVSSGPYLPCLPHNPGRPLLEHYRHGLCTCSGSLDQSVRPAAMEMQVVQGQVGVLLTNVKKITNKPVNSLKGYFELDMLYIPSPP